MCCRSSTGWPDCAVSATTSIFVEHHGWPDACWNPRTKTLSDDPSYGLDELGHTPSSWAARRGVSWMLQGTYHGLSQDEMAGVCRTADVLVGLWTVTWLDEFAECRRRIFIDTDPGLHAVRHVARSAREPRLRLAGRLPRALHLRHAHRPARLPDPDPRHHWKPRGRRWRSTCCRCSSRPDASCFTTVMAWSPRKPIVYDGVEYGLKDVEFWRIAGSAACVRRRAWKSRLAARRRTTTIRRPAGASPMPPRHRHAVDLPRLHRPVARRIQRRRQPRGQDAQRLVQRSHRGVSRLGQAGRRAGHRLLRRPAVR